MVWDYIIILDFRIKNSGFSNNINLDLKNSLNSLNSLNFLNSLSSLRFFVKSVGRLFCYSVILSPNSNKISGKCCNKTIKICTLVF